MNMLTLPPNILDKCLQEEHVLRHKYGIWNEICFYMMLETTSMKFGKDPTRIIRKTANPRTI